MGFLLRSAATIKTAVAASAIPAALAFSSHRPTSTACSCSVRFPKFQNPTFVSLSLSSSNLGSSATARDLDHAPPALHMDAPASDFKPTSQNGAVLPELLTEFMVDMKCEGCVNAVKNKLQTVEGVKNIEVDLSNQVVRILGNSPVKTLTEALEQTGRKARLIGQGLPEDFLISAAVVEFKGPDVFGVVRFAQVSMELARIEANFSGLSPGKHGWSINEYGDLTRGAASTGKIFNPTAEATADQPLGDLGTLAAGEKGEAFFSGVKEKLRVADLIGRSVALYEREDKSDAGIAAAVIARSAGVGENYKKLCTCDGTTIWESSNNDFVTSKV
ncbi:copper chaperone for superoxide dismutase, chloroplastic/cytosolic isoform X2 [Rhodamnia argentea]|uniref:Superoxide dismutase copper chaperone n=1 Tax=Rhodamnia argentea TaxID=178133 RepID=A0A8B8PV83_9MYRT|nr:copper chaperone for superoxide dismutase, chloroplastic/cytosolic isoform X2 [Rhodamnia argentea]